MSKQSEAKQAQGYKPTHIVPICMACKHCNAELVSDNYDNIKKKYYCAIGGFAVKKMGTCKLYERKEK